MRRVVLLLSIVIFFTNCSSPEEKVQKLLSDVSSQTEFNGLVYVENGNEVLYNDKLISTDGALNALEGDSRNYLASLTKLFTEITVVKLVEEGKLNLNSTISNYRENFQPSYGKVLTLENLLKMSSGLPRELNGDNLTNSLKLDDKGFAGAFLDTIPDMELSFQPGSNYEYSNLNYWLLGAVVEEVTGLNLDQAYAKYIFDPLKMNNSGYFLQEGNSINGYNKDNGNWKLDKTDYKSRYASGGAYASLQDLVKLSKALKGTAFLNDTSLSYLYGEDQTIEVYGSLPSYTNMIYINRKEDVTLIVLNNIGVPDLNKMSDIKNGVEQALGIASQKKQSPKKKITLTNISALNDSIPIEKAMKDWATAILEADKNKMLNIFNNNADKNGLMDMNDPTWDELVRIKNEWPNLKVYGYRWVEDQNPKGIELWLHCDGDQRIALQWIMEDKRGKVEALFIKPDNMTWLGQEFK